MPVTMPHNSDWLISVLLIQLDEKIRSQVYTNQVWLDCTECMWHVCDEQTP